jgi:hypothetical protein
MNTLEGACPAIAHLKPFASAGGSKTAKGSKRPEGQEGLCFYSGLDSGTAAVRIGRKGTMWVADPVWKNEQVSMYMSSPVVVGSTLYGLSHRSRGQFFAIDVASGRTLWTTPGREGENASIIAAGELLLLSTTNGELIAARASSDKFAQITRYRTAESAVWAHPAVVGQTILVKDVNTLICWSL